MELWIRSQDREKLLNCNDIAIASDSEDGKTIRGYKIVGYFDKNTEYEELGFYTSRTRALKVLDEIEGLLNPKSILKFSALLHKDDIEKIKQATENKFVICGAGQDIKLPNSIVYKMPIT